VPGLSRLGRRAGPVGLALTAWDLWRRLPPKQRKQLLKAARKHGPRIVETARKHGPTVAARVASELDAAARRKKR
jgi:adenine/guanine phosphoribosyltransferase-like PRPP-binding protein